MHASAIIAAGDGNAEAIWAAVISAVGAVVVAIFSFVSVRSTRGREGKKTIDSGDYKLRSLDLAAEVRWKPVSDEEWARQLKRMKQLRVVLVLAFVALFVGMQWSFRFRSAPIIAPLGFGLLAGLAEFGWILLNRAIILRGDRTATEAGSADLQLVIEGSQDAVVSRCIAGVRKVGHAIASVDVQPRVAEIVSIGNYGNERMRVSVEEDSAGRYRVKITAERRASFSSSLKTRRSVFRLVEQLTGYRLYSTPPQKRKGDLILEESTTGETAATVAVIPEAAGPQPESAAAHSEGG